MVAIFSSSSKGGGVTFAFPDTCKVPNLGAPVPTPYPMGVVTVVTYEKGQSTQVHKVRDGKAVKSETRRELDGVRTFLIDPSGDLRGYGGPCDSSAAAREIVRREIGSDARATVVSVRGDDESMDAFLVEPRSQSRVAVDINPPQLLAEMRRQAPPT